MVSNARVLVTGARGFIGSHLVNALTKQAVEVYGTTSQQTVTSKRLFHLDVTNYNQLEKLVQKHAITHIVHLAGESLVEKGHSSPHQTYQTNILGALHVSEVTRLHKLKKAIITSTSHVYGDQHKICSEQVQPKASRPYETSKVCADTIAQSYAQYYQLPIFIPRFVNIYGPGDMNKHRLIPHVINQVVAHENPQIWGGDARRDFMYIDDAVNAYLTLLKTTITNIDTNHIFNFGSSNIYSVEEIVNKIIAISGKELVKEIKPSNRTGEIHEQLISWEKAHDLLGWKPKISIEEGLKSTYAWYLKQKQ